MQSSALCSTKHNKKHDCCLKLLSLEGLHRFSWVFSIIVDQHGEVQGNDVFQSAARKQIKMHLWLMWIVGTTSQSVCQSVFRATLGSCKAHPAPASQSLNGFQSCVSQHADMRRFCEFRGCGQWRLDVAHSHVNPATF